MEAGCLIFDYDGKQIPGKGGADEARALKTLESLMNLAEEVLEIPKGTFDLWDVYGQIRGPEDIQRAIRMAHNGKTDCHLEVREHFVFQRLKKLEQQLNVQAAKQVKLEAQIEACDERFDGKIEAAKKELTAQHKKLEGHVHHHIEPTIEDLSRDRTQLQKEMRAIQEKIAAINLQEIKDMSDKAEKLREELASAMARIRNIEDDWKRDKPRMETEIRRMHEDLADLSKYITGKIEVCIEADGDLKREQQLTNERMQLMADDIQIQRDGLKDLTQRTTGALEESEELRTLLGTVREDNQHLRNECGQVRTRVHCIEGTATEQWEGFAPGVLYFRRFHASTKGPDIQLSSDLCTATGRGFLAGTGVVIGNDEGFCIADGPCRRFGTPGQWSSYFEIEIDERCAAPAGSGGLYIGVSLQTGEEIAEHPRREFDGWLIGGSGKALICRAAAIDRSDEQPALTALQPAAFGSDIQSSSAQKASEALKKLRKAMPSKPKGEVRELECTWSSDNLRPPDRVGVLFKCHRMGGAQLRVLVNGKVECTHEFIEAPPAEAMGFLTPVLRLAGAGKSAKLLAGLTPPSKALAEN